MRLGCKMNPELRGMHTGNAVKAGWHTIANTLWWGEAAQVRARRERASPAAPGGCQELR